MPLPVMAGVIDRRILVNYRADPAVVAGMLPAPFHPKTVRRTALVGICLIRLRQVRPRFLPAWVGLGSENAAHRFAVEWDDHGTLREGVYVRRRDTSSYLNSFAGGRIFPGVHSHARFQVRESETHFDIGIRSDDDVTRIHVVADLATALPPSSIFRSLQEASDFFQAGSLGYSATASPDRHEGLELCCREWTMEPLAVTLVRSSFFEDQAFFPPGSIALDSAFLMRRIAHEWHARGEMCCGEPAHPARVAGLPAASAQEPATVAMRESPSDRTLSCSFGTSGR